MYFYILIGYFRTANGGLCSEGGYFALDDAKTCKDVAVDLGWMIFDGTESDADYPKGCYTSSSSFAEYESAYFNTHSTGSSNSLARQICKPRGKG